MRRGFPDGRLAAFLRGERPLDQPCPLCLAPRGARCLTPEGAERPPHEARLPGLNEPAR